LSVAPPAAKIAGAGKTMFGSIVTKLAVKQMPAQKTGSIVDISSTLVDHPIAAAHSLTSREASVPAAQRSIRASLSAGAFTNGRKLVP